MSLKDFGERLAGKNKKNPHKQRVRSDFGQEIIKEMIDVSILIFALVLRDILGNNSVDGPIGNSQEIHQRQISKKFAVLGRQEQTEQNQMEKITTET